MAVIYRGPNRGYTLTDEDVLWLARAFVGEAGEDCSEQEAAYLFWCWMQRFMLVKAAWNSESWSFTDLVRAHSQPVNPLWAVAGQGKCVSHPDYCTSDKIARRAKVSGYSVSELSGFGVYQYALKAQSGDLPNPESQPIYDFAACSLIAKQGRPCTGINVGNNCFLTYECLKDSEKKNITPGSVELGTSSTKIGVVILGILFGTAVAWALWTLYGKKKR